MGRINTGLIKNDAGKVIARMKIKLVLSDEERIWRSVPSSWWGKRSRNTTEHINNFTKTQIEYNGIYQD